MLCWVTLDSSGKLSCRCTTELNHWERFRSDGRAIRCAAIGCRGGHLIGAQVKKTEGSDEEHYIVPLCPFHSKEKGEFPVDDSMLAPARKQKTCR